MFKKFMRIVLPLSVALSMLMAACGAPTATPVPPTPVPPTEVLSPTATEAPKPSIDPTGQKVTFWHVWGTGLPNETLLGIVDDFNKTNSWEITVEAVDQGKYSNLEDAFNAAVQSGDLPDLVTGYTNAMANWYSVSSVIDLSPFMSDSFFGLSDADKAAFYPGSLNGGKSNDGVYFAFPISQSANVLYYNAQWAEDLGFPNPPANYADFKAQACAAMAANNADAINDNDGTGGFVVNTGASNVASFVFANGGTMLNADGTGYNFSDSTVADVATFWKDLWDSKCAFTTESYPNPEFATRKALLVMSSTAGLPYQVAAFKDPAAINDAWTIIPFPGKNGGQAVDLYGQYVAIGKTNPEREMATWVFLKYLTSPEVQSKWIQGSAYYPTRTDTVPLLEDYAAANPIWGLGLDYLQFGKAEPAWASWSSVRREVGNTFSAILQGNPGDIPTLLADLDNKAAQAILDTK